MSSDNVDFRKQRQRDRLRYVLVRSALPIIVVVGPTLEGRDGWRSIPAISLVGSGAHELHRAPDIIC